MSESPTRLSIVEDDGTVGVTGDVDAYSAPDLAAALEPLPGDGTVTLDLAGVGFMDSSGIRVLVDAHQRGVDQQRRVVVANPSRSVRRILEISGLLEHLNVES
ncbi:STAS domain-containing protein [Ilumatobacter sp.]|uniref:STAS domain-containing protein n=1 Tax=Ilumatobacter sp. TaxID=1967498 RepID=UPI003B52338D